MTINNLLQYIQEEYGVVADYPFSQEWAPSPVFRHLDNKKWFAIGMFIPPQRLGISNMDGNIWCINVKCDPLMKSALLNKKGFYTCYHMSKEHWISIVLEEVDVEDLKFAIDMSFDLTKSKKKKKSV